MIELTQEDIDIANIKAEKIFCKLVDKINADDQIDDAAVAFALFTWIAQYLGARGWTPEELAKDAATHGAIGSCEGRS